MGKMPTNPLPLGSRSYSSVTINLIGQVMRLGRSGHYRPGELQWCNSIEAVTVLVKDFNSVTIIGGY